MKKIRLIPILLISTMFISATTAGIIKLVGPLDNETNAFNPYVTLYANGGTFYISDDQAVSQVTKIVKSGTTWAKFSKSMPTPVNPGYDIEGWQYTYDDSLPVTQDDDWIDMTDDFVFGKDQSNVRIKVKDWYGAPASNFATDSWATLLDAAEDGLAALKSKYHPSHNTFIIQNLDDADEVAAKTRTVELKGLGSYRVRVIGENHDKIVNSDKIATLTFEFVDVVEPVLGYSKDKYSSDWDKSYVRDYLNSTLRSVLPSPLNSPGVLQEVSKKTLSTVNNERVVTETSDTMFIPSLSELGFDYAPDGTSVDFGYPINEPVQDEGDAYSFYQRNYLKSTARLRYYTNYEGATEPISYWTRSPFLEASQFYGEETYLVHNVDYDGSLGRSTYSTKVNVSLGANAVAPCFCIGNHDTAYQVAVDTSIDNEVLAMNNAYISNNSDCYINLYDTLDYTVPTLPQLNESGESIDCFSVKIGMNGDPIPSVEDGVANYSFNRETGVLLLNISDKHPITDTVYVTLKYPQIRGKFYTDTWYDFVNIANQGYAHLTSDDAYGAEYKANGNSFVGLKRKVIADTIYEPSEEKPTYYVRVIGENHDVLTNDKIAPLTFAFTHGYGYGLNDFMAEGYLAFFRYIEKHPDLPQYSASVLYDILNKGNLSEGINLLNLLEAGLSSGIQESVKMTAEMQEGDVYQMVATPSKLFVLSYEELTGKNDLIPLAGEGTQYEYYANSSSAASRKAVLPFASDNMPQSEGECNFNNYLTRSLYKNNKKCSIVVNGINGVFSASDTTLPTSIVPAFAIGVNP